MYRKELYLIPFTLIILIVFSGCVTTLQGYQPKGPEEIKIRELLLKFENTLNSRDVPGYLALWNDKAQIMYGKDRQIASKKEYTQILPERMKGAPKVKVGAPDIKVSGNKAEVSFVLSLGDFQRVTTYYLIKENDLWSIMGNKY